MIWNTLQVTGIKVSGNVYVDSNVFVERDLLWETAEGRTRARGERWVQELHSEFTAHKKFVKNRCSCRVGTNVLNVAFSTTVGFGLEPARKMLLRC